MFETVVISNQNALKAEITRIQWSSDEDCSFLGWSNIQQAVIYPLVNQHNYGKSSFLMGKSTISMAIFNSYVKLPEGITR